MLGRLAVVAVCLVVASGTLVAMVPDEAAKLLAGRDDGRMRQAQEALIAAGYDALPTLTALAFSKDAQASERAKHCRRCILYGVSLVLADQWLERLRNFHALTDDEQKGLLDDLSKVGEPAVRIMIHLHSRVIEKTPGSSSLERIEQSFFALQEKLKEKAGPASFDARLLVPESLAMILHCKDVRRATGEDKATYASWVGQFPGLRDLIDLRGIQWEMDRLKQAKALDQAVAMYEATTDNRVRDRIDRDLYYWIRGEIKDWKSVSPDAMHGMLTVLGDTNRQMQWEAYLGFLEGDPSLADRLKPQMKHLEVRRLIEEKRVYDAHALALASSVDEAQSGKLMEMLGKAAVEHPDYFVRGLPDPGEMGDKVIGAFLHGITAGVALEDEAGWWQVVGTFKELMVHAGSRDAWMAALKESENQRIFVFLLAEEGRLEEAFGEGVTHGNDMLARCIAYAIRKHPGQQHKVPLQVKYLPLLRQVVTNLWIHQTSGPADLRVANQLVEAWTGVLPDLFAANDSLPRPLVAIRHWDDSKYVEAIKTLRSVGPDAFGGRLAAGLFQDLEPAQITQILHEVSPPKHAIVEWMKVLLDDRNEERVRASCAVIRELGENGRLDEQELTIRSNDLKDLLYRAWVDGKRSIMGGWLATYYPFAAPTGEREVLLLAELIGLTSGIGEVETLLKSSESFLGPLHRAALLRVLGRGDQALGLLASIENKDFVQRVLREQGRYQDSVKVKSEGTKSSRDFGPEVHAAEVLRLDQEGKDSEARDQLRKWQLESKWLRVLVGVDIEGLIVSEFDNYEGIRLMENTGMQAAILPILENRILRAAAGHGGIADDTMNGYFRVAAQLPDQERVRMLLARWADIPPQRMEEMIGSGGRRVSRFLCRTMFACGMEQEARRYLQLLLEDAGGLESIDGSALREIFGWGFDSKSWRDGVMWRLMAMEHPDLPELERMIQIMWFKLQRQGFDRPAELVALIRRHQGALTPKEVRRLLKSWADMVVTLDLKDEQGVDAWLETFLAAVEHPLPYTIELVRPKLSFWRTPDDMKELPVSKIAVVKGMEEVRDAWQAGEPGQARALLRDLTIRVLLDRKLPRSLHIYLITHRPAGYYSAGRRYDMPELLIQCAAVNDLPAELMMRDVEAVCRATDQAEETSIEALERIGMARLALELMRQNLVKRQLSATSMSAARDDVPLLRRLECRAAMESGSSEAVLRALDRYLAVAPRQQPFLLLVRQWFSDRGDSEGAAEVDRMVTGFWQDRLLMLPGFKPYLDEISQWLMAVAKMQGR